MRRSTRQLDRSLAVGVCRLMKRSLDPRGTLLLADQSHLQVQDTENHPLLLLPGLQSHLPSHRSALSTQRNVLLPKCHRYCYSQPNRFPIRHRACAQEIAQMALDHVLASHSTSDNAQPSPSTQPTFRRLAHRRGCNAQAASAFRESRAVSNTELSTLSAPPIQCFVLPVRPQISHSLHEVMIPPRQTQPRAS